MMKTFLYQKVNELKKINELKQFQTDIANCTAESISSQAHATCSF